MARAALGRVAHLPHQGAHDEPVAGAGARSPLRSLPARVLLAVTAAAVALLLIEGAAAVFAGRLIITPAVRRLCGAEPATGGDASDLFGRVLSQAPPRSAPSLDELGLYAAHADPLVGYTLRPNASLSILDGSIRSDGLGLRANPGPPPPADALRIVVLGDSVAFGFGLDDDATLAARLQPLLAAARGSADRARPVSCRTVAMPGWNHRNAARFLIDHWDALHPEIVICMPIGNDLMDTDGVTERSLRRAAPDIAQRDPWLSVYQGLGLAWLKPALKQVLAGDPAALAALLGTAALDADLSPESSLRYDDNADTLVLLDAWLRERGCHLLVAHYVESAYGWRLRERLLHAAPGLAQLPLYTGIGGDFTLPTDPHPNEDTVDAMAHWVADELFALGWVPRGDGPPVPAVDDRYLKLRAESPAPEKVAAVCAGLRKQGLASLRDTLDWRTADGLAQVIGGQQADGSAGARLVALVGRLKPEADALEVELAPIAGRPDLYPLQVAVEANGVPVGTLTLEAEGSTRAVLPLPAAVSGSAASDMMQRFDARCLEVRLVPERWVVADVRGTDTLMSFRPVRIATVHAE